MPPSLRRLLLVATALAALAGGTAAADAGPRERARVAQADAAKAAKARAATDAALAAVRASEQRRAALAKDRAALARRYEGELAEIDKLKRQKASWRRDRQLRARMADSLETARELSDASNELVVLDGKLVTERRALIAAIDAELAAGAAAERAKTLRGARAEAAAHVAPKKPRKIVLPDDELDPHAAPEELDAQAQALRASEAELARQIASLERQVARFRKQAELRRQHQRADELAQRDDTSPRRSAGAGGGARDDAVGPASDPGAPEADDLGGAFEGDPVVVLSDVVDAGTIDALRKAERSTDPTAKAAAAEKARDAVARRLQALEQRRRAIEQRARELRK